MEAYPVIFCCHNILSLLLIYPAKGLHKGTSEAPVLSESEREHRSKAFLWGEGKRKRFPLQLLRG